jgi:hypothetical protein
MFLSFRSSSVLVLSSFASLVSHWIQGPLASPICRARRGRVGEESWKGPSCSEL